MSNSEPNLRESIIGELRRTRERMREMRYIREHSSIYESNLCAICGRRFMTGTLCRKHHGNVCEKHCRGCEHFEQEFYHCLYRETEPVDTRKWKLVCICQQKEELLPKYAIADTPDENGDYTVIDMETGEIQSFIAKYFPDLGAWACVEYMPPGA